MSEINTTQMRIAMQDENYRNVWLNGTTHFDGCEYTHYPCAVLKLCDEVDALRAELAAARAEAERLREIIQKAEWADIVQGYSTRAFYYTCPLCGSDEKSGHLEICPFYQWEAPNETPA